MDLEPMTITCPRCEQEKQARFFGPCPDCVQQLRSTQGGEKRALEAAEYEPKMNVVPNQIATKE